MILGSLGSLGSADSRPVCARARETAASVLESRQHTAVADPRKIVGGTTGERLACRLDRYLNKEYMKGYVLVFALVVVTLLAMAVYQNDDVLPMLNPVETTTPSATAVYQTCVSSIVTVTTSCAAGTIYGSGFVVSSDGYMVTASSVVRPPAEEQGDADMDASLGSPTETEEVPTVVYVTLHDGSVQIARVVAVDGHADVALLKIEATALVPLTILGQPRAGETVLVIGNAHGLDPTSLATGIVRNPAWKDPQGHSYLTNILTTVPTERGVGGAPILNLDGHVVGLYTSSMLSLSRDRDGQKYASSTSFGGGLSGPLLKRIVERYMTQDRRLQACDTTKYLPGFSVQTTSPADRAEHKPPSGYRIIATAIDGESSNGPAEGDILVSINGRSVGPLPEDDAFGDVTWFLSEGAKIDLVIHRYMHSTKTFQTLRFRQPVTPFVSEDMARAGSYAPQVLFVPNVESS